jgi:hypothetical protein
MIEFPPAAPSGGGAITSISPSVEEQFELIVLQFFPIRNFFEFRQYAELIHGFLIPAAIRK